MLYKGSCELLSIYPGMEKIQVYGQIFCLPNNPALLTPAFLSLISYFFEDSLLTSVFFISLFRKLHSISHGLFMLSHKNIKRKITVFIIITMKKSRMAFISDPDFLYPSSFSNITGSSIRLSVLLPARAVYGFLLLLNASIGS